MGIGAGRACAAGRFGAYYERSVCLIRFHLPLAIAVFCLPFRAPARTNEFLPELPDLPLWDHSLNLRVAAGYKDNLLLNRAATESSYLLATTLETMILRLPLDNRQFTFLAQAEDVRYPQGERVRKEQTVLALAQVKLDLRDGIQGGFAVEYIYQDQVFDVSATDTNIEPLQLVGHRIALRPSVRWKLPEHLWLEAEASLQRQWFAAPVDDYWEVGPKFTVGRDYGHRSALSLSYQYALRPYDERAPLQPDGTPVAGATLQFSRHDLDLTLRHNWDARRRWRTVTRLNCLFNEDNNSGYFDYRLYKLTQQIRCVARPWEFKVQARVSRYDFVAQTVSVTNPSLREKTLIAAGARAERELNRHLKLFADYDYEASLSNRQSDEYRAHKVSAGADWQF